MFQHALTLVCLATFAVCIGCATHSRSDSAAPRFAIAIHGGAGVLSKTAPPDEVAAYEQALRTALTLGRDMLAAGRSSVDTVEAVVRVFEDDPKFNAGKGAVYTAQGTHELDASIMDGRDLSCGAVAGVRTVKNPISLARMVKERSRHVLLASDGAEQFADEMKVERVPNTYFDTEKRRRALDEWKKENGVATANRPPYSYGTVGCVALDAQGNLAAATSTGGMTGKRFGRVGDTPIIGAGCYANNATCAVSCTGTGEQFIRHGVAKTISDRMELAHESVEAAASHVVFKTLNPDDGGLIAVAANGDIVLVYNSEGMFRGAADSSGRFEVGIWAETKK
ncbi:MAG: isoaspartyl peptidase/L-asparaginase family protein [Phycisphaerales bacterium]